MNPVAPLLASLQTELGADAILSAKADLDGFIEDWRGRYKAPALCVALPSTAAQVSAVVRLCAAHGVPVLPQGGNTSLCGGAVPASEGARPVIVNLSRMRRIRSIDTAN
ncbi:MAG: FAD-binding oxidoreductase, partial [Paraburkholderia fungorum]|nr:FAD-binding oxidoreductase [Paraburkholderia fungorum]